MSVRFCVFLFVVLYACSIPAFCDRVVPRTVEKHTLSQNVVDTSERERTSIKCGAKVESKSAKRKQS